MGIKKVRILIVVLGPQRSYAEGELRVSPKATSSEILKEFAKSGPPIGPETIFLAIGPDRDELLNSDVIQYVALSQHLVGRKYHRFEIVHV